VPFRPPVRPTPGMIVVALTPRRGVACSYTGSCVRLSITDAYALTAPDDPDVITIEAAENNGADIESVAKAISTDKKLCIGVLSHRSLQVELPDDIAALIRKALAHIAPERLLLSSDCGFGRQGMSRTHAYYKMIAMVRGANIVKRELGLPETDIPAGNERLAL